MAGAQPPGAAVAKTAHVQAFGARDRLAADSA